MCEMGLMVSVPRNTPNQSNDGGIRIKAVIKGRLSNHV